MGEMEEMEKKEKLKLLGMGLKWQQENDSGKAHDFLIREQRTIKDQDA